MKASYAILAVCDLMLMGITLILGNLVEGNEGFTRHFLMGMLTAFYTCFVHVVFFVYFIVQEKIFVESIYHHRLEMGYGARISSLKSRALMLSMTAIVVILLTSFLGAAAGLYLRPIAHGIAGWTAWLINAVVFFRQYGLLHTYRGVFREAFGE